MSRKSVLFLCVGNSCRSQLAEALLRHLAGDQFEVHSAGLDPKPIHPLTFDALHEAGVDASGLASKNIERFLHGPMLDFVIIVCAEGDSACPDLRPVSKHVLRWPFDDPAKATGGDQEKMIVFRRVRDEIRERLAQWIALPRA